MTTTEAARRSRASLLPRGARRWAGHRFRQVSAPLRVLPDFLIIGAQKAGTTSLFRWLTAHPQVLTATSAKELHFFDGEPERWSFRYRRNFPRRSVMASGSLTGGRPAVTGEATPSYLFHPGVPARVGALLPNVRLIAVLREPVSRALSHYAMNVRKGYEELPLGEAIDAEEARIADGRRQAMAGRPLTRSEPFLRFSYVARGQYAAQLRRWFDVVPREQLLILQTDELVARPGDAYARVIDFLGLDPVPLTDSRNHNPGRRPATTAADRAALVERFAESNVELERLTGIAWPT